MKISSEQIKKDVEYLSTILDNDEQINEVLQHCENFGVLGLHSIFVKSLYSSPKVKHQKCVRDFMTMSILTYQSSTTIIG